MGAEVITHHRMWCDDCRVWLKDDRFKYTQVVNFDHEDTMYDQASKSGWVLDHDTASWYCPDCQKDTHDD